MVALPDDVRGKKVFVAMSGGVDSSVAAALLQEAGCDVEGVTMCFSVNHPESRRPSCCGVEGISDARTAAKILGIPHHVLDFAGDINELVIEDFVSEYLNGRTPNPCVRCNQYLKFGTLYKMVMSQGVDYLATGHYARLGLGANGQHYELKKARDIRKDQSYFLYSMAKEIFSHVLFPLGDLVKDDVRALARKFALPNADKVESQDICFVPEGGYQQFIRNRIGDEYFKSGNFVDHDGKVVGQHQGVANYTIGQRDKLGMALGRPVYVYRIDKVTNTVYVGPEECLYAKGLVVTQFNNLRPDILAGNIEVNVRIRYNAPEVSARIRPLSEGSWQVEFEQPQKSVTPGQSLVCYLGDDVLGGGLIDRAVAI